MKIKIPGTYADVLKGIRNYIDDEGLPVSIVEGPSKLHFQIKRFGTSTLSFQVYIHADVTMALIDTDIAWTHKGREEDIKGYIAEMAQDLGGTVG